MAMVMRRRRGLGAFDPNVWADYQARLTHGIQSGPPNGTIDDPNGGVLHFDGDGNLDYYTPSSTPQTDATVNKDPGSTFFGWTNYEQAAYWAAQDPANAGHIVTDFLRSRATFAPGSNVSSNSAADIATNAQQLLAFAASSPKVQAALQQLKTGAFRGAQQATFDATNAATKLANAHNTVNDWLAYRAPFVRQGQVLPLMPPQNPYLVGLDAETLQDVKDIVAGLPPDPPPPVAVIPQPTSTLPPVIAPGPPPPPPPLPQAPTLLPPSTVMIQPPPVMVQPPMSGGGGGGGPDFPPVNPPSSNVPVGSSSPSMPSWLLPVALGAAVLLLMRKRS
jgi:hypothetical protein